MADLQTLDPVTGAAPASRIKDAASLNETIKNITRADIGSAGNRHNVQRMADGSPPFSQRALDESGQGGRCNLNFGDGKARLKAEESGYYDLTESVPTLCRTQSTYGDKAKWSEINGIMSEELHTMLKGWDSFDSYFQLQVKKTVLHGMAFLYFGDDLNWQWEVAGLEDFKLPRSTTLSERKVDIAVAFRDVTVGELYSWIANVDRTDKRWNLKEVRQAIMKASDSNQIYSENGWEQFQTILKNNDIWASNKAQESVHIAHAWVREFSGKVSHFMTLRDGGNEDFLFKCLNRFDSVNQCFTFFPYEVGSNGTLHSVRGLGHEIYAPVQVLNALRCQTVDNAKLSGSLLIQPKTATDAQDLAIMFYAGAAYIPPDVNIVNGQLNNPSTNTLPVIQDMSMMMRRNTGDVNTQDRSASQSDKTKFEVQSELTKESVLPTALMNLFYQPWGRHLNEVWRRVQNKDLKSTDPGGREVHDFRARCVARGVPAEALTTACRVIPVRAMGYGSPGNRLMALDEFLQYYGSLDPVGQNNLLRMRFAQKVGYQQVDDFVPKIEEGGRGPIDVEIAELQNGAMSMGVPATVLPGDHHIIHLQSHLPNVSLDLDQIEGGQGTPQLLASVQTKIQHSAEHMKFLKPDKLQEATVSELTRVFNNTAERVSAAMDHAQRQAAKEQAQAPQQTDALQQAEEAHAQKMRHTKEEHDLKMALKQQEADQRLTQADALTASRLRAEAAKRAVTGK